MSVESVRDSSSPPRVTGDVDIARFPSLGEAAERWRVSINGRVHFLSDAETARRIFALAHGSTYAGAYQCYVELAAEEASAFEAFIAWSEKHRVQLQQLADTPDGHPLKFRRRLLSDTHCDRLARHMVWLYERLTAVLLLLVSVILVGEHIVSSHSQIQGSFWLAIPLAFIGIFFHELGHITACVRFGARQGGIGLGLYWIWPAFYADVRGSWSLPASQRLQVSVGGLYFQSIYAALLAGLEMATGRPTFGMSLDVTLLLMATTCNPVFKYDGYWILADLFNITNIHTRIATHLKQLLRNQAGDRRALMASRWTWLAAIFAAGAAGYIAYIGVELFRSASTGLQQLGRNWHALTASTPVANPIHLWLSSGGLVLQLALVGVAIVMLGMRSLRSTASILQGRGEDDDVRSKQEPGAARSAAR